MLIHIKSVLTVKLTRFRPVLLFSRVIFFIYFLLLIGHDVTEPLNMSGSIYL